MSRSNPNPVPINKKLPKTCFVIMPITVPHGLLPIYGGEEDHFGHVYEFIFEPVIRSLEFVPIPPFVQGSKIILKEILQHLVAADLVLCDISIFNPNVFFELGVRTSLNKPVVLVCDNVTKKSQRLAPYLGAENSTDRDYPTERLPFDLQSVGVYTYRHDLLAKSTKTDRAALKDHILSSMDEHDPVNAIWRIYGPNKSDRKSGADATLDGLRISIFLEYFSENSPRPMHEIARHRNMSGKDISSILDSITDEEAQKLFSLSKQSLKRRRDETVVD